MDSSDHPRADVASAGLGDELADRLPCSTAELAEQLAAIRKIGSQKLGYSERPKTMTHLLDHFLAQEGAEEYSALRRAGGAEPSSGAGEGKEILVLASFTEDAGEAVLEVAAVEKGVHDSLDEAAPAAA